MSQENEEERSKSVGNIKGPIASVVASTAMNRITSLQVVDDTKSVASSVEPTQHVEG